MHLPANCRGVKTRCSIMLSRSCQTVPIPIMSCTNLTTRSLRVAEPTRMVAYHCAVRYLVRSESEYYQERSENLHSQRQAVTSDW
jgi:hypothetical protein